MKNHGARGTYYASMGMMAKHNAVGRHFVGEDLAELLRDGHELGCHTFGHRSCRSGALRDFVADAQRGAKAVDRFTEGTEQYSFSYPYGHVTFGAKRRIGSLFSSCRGIFPGVNKSPVDLNLLRANSIYSNTFDLRAITRLLDTNEGCKGWVIFYTHDISDAPSAFGCRPCEFESVVRLAVERQSAVLPVGQVVRGPSFDLAAGVASMANGRRSEPLSR